MKIIKTFITTFLTASILFAQEADISQYAQIKNVKGVFLGISSGINNPAGFVGIRVNGGITPKTMLDIGMGIGTWGYKLSAGAILNSHKQKGLVPVVGLSYVSGVNNLNIQSVDLINHNLPHKPIEDTTLNANLNPGLAVNLGVQWQFYSKKGNRFAIDLGYCALLAGGDIKVLNEGYTMTDFTEKAIKLLRPGGFIIGLSYLWLR